MKCQFIILVVLVGCVSWSVQKQEEDDTIDINKYAEMAASFLKDQSGESIGGLVNNFIQGGGGKQLGDMLLNMGNQQNTNQILESVGSLLNQGGTKQKRQAGSKETETQGFDPAILGTVFSMFSNMNSGRDSKNSDDSTGMFSFLGDMLQQEGGLENVMQFLPMIASTLNSFTGEEAKKREEAHTGHSWILPPFLEHIHVAFDHFLNSDLGKTLLKNLGTEKIVKVFSDSEGRFNMDKFVDLLENHSFRKHWIEMATRRIAGLISYFADPNMQRKFMTTAQYFINSLLRSQGFPKNSMFDSTRPTETLSAFLDYFIKTYFNFKIDAKEYVKPAVKYVREVIALTQKHGYFTGREIDSSELSHKLADTINLEIIEPGARVYRAYRYAKKNPKCDRYVLCLINQAEPNEQLSLPGLKRGLSMSGSMVASWFLSTHTDTPFWSLYNIITEETNCQAYYSERCSTFYNEELKVTTEYVHNEL